jgi:hypothetical protein
MVMGQLYLQRFEYRGAIDKAAFDETWRLALEAFAKSGNWGGVGKGVKHIHSYGTAWGGYVMIEVDDPKVFDQYQMFHTNTYSQMVRITFEPLSDMDEGFAPTIKELRAKSGQ